MKLSSAIVFYSVLIIVFTPLNYYILARTAQAAQNRKYLKIALTTVVATGYISFLSSVWLEKTNFQFLAALFKAIGSYWLAYMVYIILFLVLIDILRITGYLIGYNPRIISQNIVLFKAICLYSIIIISSLFIIVGIKNATNTRIRKVSINLPRKNSTLTHLKIMFVSDIHMGATIGQKDVERIVIAAQEIKPDIILLGGDILDSDVKQAISNNSGKPLKKLDVPLNVYAITGNHEYLGGNVEKAVKYVEGLNVRFIRDRVININNQFYLAGREDKDKEMLTGVKRADLKSILDQASNKLPVILLDHQPFNLEDASHLGVDLQLSGHTHNGQMWPLNYITNAVFEKGWGYTKQEDTHYYISCGFGAWGPKIKIGSSSEIVIINISFI